MPLSIGAQPVAVHAGLREGGDLFCKLDRGAQRLAVGDDTVGQADALRFVGSNRAPGQDHVERAALADDPRQADGAAVDQRHTPAAAIDAEYRAGGGDAEVAPERERSEENTSELQLLMRTAYAVFCSIQKS